MKCKVVVILFIVLSAVGAPWFSNWAIGDKLNASMAIATVGAVVVALFGAWFESLLYSPNIEIDVNQELIDHRSGYWVRGKVTNRGNKTANLCRARITVIEGRGFLKSDVYNGFLQWQGGDKEKDTVNLNPEEHMIFDIGIRGEHQDAPLSLISHLGKNQISHDLGTGAYILTVKIFGDNFEPKSISVRILLESTGSPKISSYA